MLSAVRKIKTASLAIASLFVLTALVLGGFALKARTSRSISKPVSVSFEVLPGRAEKIVNKAEPVVSAVIYGSPTLDVNTIDPASIKLAGSPLMRRASGRLKMKVVDVNKDGTPDLNFVVWSDKLQLSEGAHVASVEAKTFDGREIVGQHKVEVVNRPLHTESAQNTQQNRTVSGQKQPPGITPDVGSTFTNPAAITINDGPTPPTIATPYPSNITVSGIPFPSVNGYKYSVKLLGITHTFVEDVDMLLVGPGTVPPNSLPPRMVIWSDVGGSTGTTGVSNISVVLNDVATPTLPTTTNFTITSATCPVATVETITACHFKPTADTPAEGNTNYPAPAPCGDLTGCGSTVQAAPSGAATLNGTFNNGALYNPNGTWSLYIIDDLSGDGGSMANGWGITVVAQAPTAAPSTVSGTINTPDGTALEGVAVELKGSQSQRAITDSLGHYQFDNVATGEFYTVTPARANYSFSPASRSFSSNGEHVEAAFTADATQSVANPLDTDLFFVRQQYVDFLNREPDSGGLGYWADQISQCGVDDLCLSNRRTDVSAAFFMEREFQQTGSFVYGLYKGSFGRNPQFSEFMPDRSRIGVGDQLDSSKQALADEWVTRAEFKAQYPDSMSNESFVNKLFDVAGLSGYSAQRQSYINQLNAGGTRSGVLRGVIEGDAFRTKEYNRAFVLTEYFSYLRRDPDAAGFDFWVNVLDSREPGNFRGMVCSFVTSAEYQKRFSSVVTHSNSECGR